MTRTVLLFRPLNLKPSFYLDIPVRLREDHLNKFRVLECIKEVGIEAVEVGLDADTLHH